MKENSSSCSCYKLKVLYRKETLFCNISCLLKHKDTIKPCLLRKPTSCWRNVALCFLWPNLGNLNQIYVFWNLRLGQGNLFGTRIANSWVLRFSCVQDTEAVKQKWFKSEVIPNPRAPYWYEEPYFEIWIWFQKVCPLRQFFQYGFWKRCHFGHKKKKP